MTTEASGGAAPNTPPADSGANPDQKMADLVNGAVTGHLKRALPKALEEGLGALETRILASLEAKLPKAAATQAAGSQGAAQTGAAAPNELEAKVADLQSKLETEQRARRDGERRVREERALNDLRAELTSAKVRPELVGDLADLLFHARRSVKVATDGAVTMTVDGEDYPLREGVAAFVRTKGAASYLPPPTPARRGGQVTPPAQATTTGAPQRTGSPFERAKARIAALAERNGAA